VKSPDQLAELFRQRGLKVTPQRQCIFGVLHRQAGSHPTADAVYAAVVAEMPAVSLKTVYQTLNDLSAMGELAHLDLGAGPARFDANLDAHQHLVCDGCGRVWDVYAEFTELRVPEAQAEGFRVSSTEVVFRGRCERCDRAVSEAGRRGIGNDLRTATRQ
jgi:Fur family peroxide stress response transcriptional regulator